MQVRIHGVFLFCLPVLADAAVLLNASLSSLQLVVSLALEVLFDERVKQVQLGFACHSEDQALIDVVAV